MSNSPISARLPEGDKQRLEDFADDEGIGVSKALERAADRGLQAYGYDSSGLQRDTHLRRFAAEGARLGVYTAAALVGVDLTTPLNFVTYIAAMLAISVVMLTVERNASRVESWFSRPEAAGGRE